MMHLLNQTLDGGRVIRYHAVPSCHNPLQDVAQHSWNVIILLMHITDFKCGANLLMEAAMHDTAELMTGDIPYTVKRDNPELKKTLALLEKKHRREDTIHDEFALTPEEKALLKVCDTLDGFIWCAKHEDRSGPVEDRWHDAYLIAREKFQFNLTPIEWARADALFVSHGGELTREATNNAIRTGGVPFDA
jgi:5'-deoxynucleotidase YfbR-like HD superfamily hydrolase